MGVQIRGVDKYEIYVVGDIQESIIVDDAGLPNHPGILLEFSDGTSLRMRYQKPHIPHAWNIEVLKKGDLFGNYRAFTEKDMDSPYYFGRTDYVWLKDGIKWGRIKKDAKSKWRYLRVHIPYLDMPYKEDEPIPQGTKISANYRGEITFYRGEFTFEGEFEDTVLCWELADSKYNPGVFIVFSDETILRIKGIPKEDFTLWKIEPLKKGPLFGVHVPAEKTMYGKSDIVWMKAGIKWASRTPVLEEKGFQLIQRYCSYPPREENKQTL